jgi:hypothetical protein
MRSVLVMVTNILGEQSLQMAFIQRNNMVQQVSSTASHPPKIDYAASFEFAFGDHRPSSESCLGPTGRQENQCSDQRHI